MPTTLKKVKVQAAFEAPFFSLFFSTVTLALQTSDRSHAVDIGTKSEGHRFLAVKRIGRLKTSDFEGYKHSDEGLWRMRKKKKEEKLQGAKELDLGILIMLSSKASNAPVEHQLVVC